MRGFVVIVLASLFLIGLTPVSAQTVFSQGVYQFESTIASMTYGGTWTTVTGLGPTISYRSANANGSSVQFDARGGTLIVWRWVTLNQAAYSMNVCVGASCIAVANGATGQEGWYFFSVTLPPGLQTITLTRTTGAMLLDYFMVLDATTASFSATAVPTATILPSSTPAFTATPGPSPVFTATAVPTATPYVMPAAIWAIDPAASYGSTDGQITSVGYSATAADIQLANLLTMLLLSVWGMFIFAVFVLVRFKR